MRPDPQLYLGAEWLQLRETVIERDGFCCRNCGSANRLEVHHWLPMPAHRENVDGRGYAKEGNPLIVHASGLITLCPDCHNALTECRTRQAILSDPQLQKMAQPNKKSDNIFELWALNGKQLPFRVRKDSWSLKTVQFYRVERIEITKWPYGKAWGRYVRNGEAGDLVKIPSPGTFTWRLSDEKDTEGQYSRHDD